MVKVALALQNIHLLTGGDLASLLEVAQDADRRGIDHLLLGDHLLMSAAQAGDYPVKLPVDLDFDQLEPMVLFGAIAAVTTRIRLITGIVLGPLRSAPLLAKQAATLDVVSRGRLDLGLGVGWQEAEYSASGVPFEGRSGRMEDQIRACRVLWTQAPASFTSRTVSFEQVYAKPFPVQPGGPPVWFGCNLSERNLPRVAALGDGWIVSGAGDQKSALPENIGKLRRALEAQGRDPTGFPVSFAVGTRYASKDEMIAEARELAAMGATMLSYRPGFTCRTAEELAQFVDWMLATKDALGGA